MSAVLEQEIASVPPEIAELPIANACPPNLRPFRFQPGHAPLPGVGRPKGTVHPDTVLALALKAAQQRRNELKEPCLCTKGLSVPVAERWAFSCKTLDAHFVRRAFLSDEILIALQKKRLPDKKQVDSTVPLSVNLVLMPPADPSIALQGPPSSVSRAPAVLDVRP